MKQQGFTGKEQDLYPPVKAFFEDLGYQVRGEVKDCDVCAVRENILVAVELKKTFNLKLLTQGVRRQKTSDLVYLAVPAPADFQLRGTWREHLHLLKRLGLGLLFVRPDGRIQVIESPGPEQAPRITNPGLRQKICKEIQGRSIDGNIGGSAGGKRLTAYRENALKLAVVARIRGQVCSTDGALVGLTTTQARGILKNNYYGWFEHITARVFTLTPEGEAALQDYQQVVAPVWTVLTEMKTESQA